MVPLINMQLGEVIVGGVGAGLYGMLLFALLAVFIAGLMVGRTPEYLGKKIEAREVKMTMLAILCLPLMILGLTALAVVVPTGTASIQDAGPHGFSEVLYAYTSAAANNGSAFAGLSGNTPFYNLTLALAMFVGRFFVILPMLAIAGSLAAKKTLPPSAGALPTHGPLFVGLLVAVVLIVGGLTYFPALALGAGGRAPGDAGGQPLLRSDVDEPGKEKPAALLDPAILVPALGDAVRKLDPRVLVRNPVMFVVEVVTILTTAAVPPRLSRAEKESAFPCRSSSGCGSHCCSPTSPKPSPRDGARRRRRRCARPAPRRSQS